MSRHFGQDTGPSATEPVHCEGDRLAALARYSVLDTAPEAGFDDLARLAAQICGVSVGLITFVDDRRQFFKARIGFDGDPVASLDNGFCPIVVSTSAALIVPDTRAHPDYAGNMAVTQGGVIFYAGVPLVTPDGHTLGTLCVLDRVPHDLTSEQQAGLHALANQVVGMLELRRALLRASSEGERAECEVARVAEHARRLELLARASARFMVATDADTTVRYLYASIAATFRLDICFYFACQDGGLGLVFAAGLTPEQEALAARLEFGQTICGIVAASREAVHITGIQDGDDPQAAFLKALGVDTYASTPLLAGGELLGTLSFGRQAGPFSDGELEVLRTLVSYLAMALQRLNVNETLERRVAERTAELRENQARLRTIFETSYQLQGLLALDGTLLDANATSLAVIEAALEDVVGKPFWDTPWFTRTPGMPETVREGVLAVAKGKDVRLEVAIHVPSGLRSYDSSLRHIRDAYGRIVGIVLEAMDITERRQVEEALHQSQKMEAVGQLTGGLAHDFNNLLVGISGSLELLQTRMAQGRMDDLDRYITAAQGASKRAAALTHRLLAFTRRQTLDPKATDVNHLVVGMEELIRRTVGPQILVEVIEADGLWATLVDPNQLENALLNLCINARDAMPGGGSLTIETGNKRLGERGARERDLKPGQYVVLSVSDTGLGMTPEVIRRAFDPFFTTKPIGKGTGLGLSMIYGFVQQSGGQARIYSEPGEGAMVCLYLPRHSGAAEDKDEPAGEAETPRAVEGETVLVVDDEPIVRMLISDVLKDMGYISIEAADGAAGLKVLRSNVRIDLLVTDVGLPGGMNGRQVADAGRAVRPGLKVLFITGYAANVVLNQGHLEPGMQVLTKPFVMDVLASRIRRMIETDINIDRSGHSPCE